MGDEAATVINEERLSSVPWGELQHAYGSAGNIPERLRSFAALCTKKLVTEDERKQFDDARGNWYADVFHQGTVFSVSSRVAPFMIDVFNHKECSPTARSFIADYLHNLVHPYFYDLFPQRIDVAQLMAVAKDADDIVGNNNALINGDFEALPDVDERTQNAAFVRFARDTYVAVESGVESIVQTVRGAFETIAPDTLMRVASLLACFPRKKDVIVPLLWSMVKDKKPIIGSIALVAIVQLGESKDVHQFAVGYRKGSDDEASLYGAASELLLRVNQGPTSEPNITTQDAEVCVLNRKWSGSKFPCPLAGSVRLLVSRLIVHAFATPIRDDALVLLGENLALTQGMGQVEFVQAICTVTKMNERGSNPLSPEQRRAVELFAKHVTWVNGIFGNVAAIFRANGLPYNKQKLLEMLEPVPAATE